MSDVFQPTARARNLRGERPSRAAAPGPASFDKIKVKGGLYLGERMKLIQTARRPSEEERVRYHFSGSAADFDACRPGSEGGVGEVLDYALEADRGRRVEIKDDGMVTSYGIFGAPGSGKTVLMLNLLEQLFAHSSRKPAEKYGALILDPKASLIDDIREVARSTSRLDDLHVINAVALNQDERGEDAFVNVIDCTLDPQELGALLVLAGRSAGVDARDPFWFQEWTNLFASALGILRAEAVLRHPLDPRPVTLRQLMTALQEEVRDQDGKSRRQIQAIADKVVGRVDSLSQEMRIRWRLQTGDARIDAASLDRFFRQNYVGTIDAFATKAFGMFRRDRLACYSAPRRRPNAKPFYEDIIENGRIVLVSVSPAEPALAKTLCTLIKCLFQRTVLARAELLANRKIANAVRPLVMACDEYSEIASEVPGQSMGDGQFLALARQYGCMALLATQSVNVLEASSLRETWRSVFSNFAAKIYMRLADNETADAASQLAGTSDWRIISRSRNFSAGGGSAGQSHELRERPNLPKSVLTQVLRRGEAAVIGSLDAGQTQPGTFFLQVPPPKAAALTPSR
jgi:hypothetical protein